MKPHIKLYMSFFDYTISDFIPSELSGQRAVDVHHISCRGSGGSKEKDYIENLIGLTREEHTERGDKECHMVYLYVKHFRFIMKKRPDYDIKYHLVPMAYRSQVLFQLGIIT